MRGTCNAMIVYISITSCFANSTCIKYIFSYEIYFQLWWIVSATTFLVSSVYFPTTLFCKHDLQSLDETSMGTHEKWMYS